MAAQPNLPAGGRIAYAVAGVLLIGWGFGGADSGWARYLLPVLGGFLLVEGIIGYCVILAALGVNRKVE